jgi:hypothetical protein
VRLLINGGAHINAQGGGYRSALQAALEGGYKQLVRLLTNQSAYINHLQDANAQGAGYRSALQAASSGGHE